MKWIAWSAAVAACAFSMLTLPETALADPTDTYNIIVVNPGALGLKGYPVDFSMAGLPDILRTGPLCVCDAAGKNVLSQMDDLDGDGIADALAFLVDLAPLERKSLSLALVEDPATERTLQTDLSVEQVDEKRMCLRNKYIKMYIAKEDPSSWTQKLVNAATGKAFIQSLAGGCRMDETRPFLTAPGNTGRRTIWRLINAGPVRIVAEKAYDYRDPESGEIILRYRMRYVLNRTSPSMGLRMILENLTDEPQNVPDIALEGKAGPLLKPLDEELIDYDWPKEVLMGVDVLGRPKNQDRRSGRHNNLWVHRGLGNGLSVIQDAIKGWNSLELLPDGTLKIAGLGGKKSGLKLEPHSRIEIPLLVRYHDGSPERAVREHLRDLRTCGGLVTVYGEGGRVLEVAGCPDYLAESFENANRWICESGTGVKISDGRMRISAAEGTARIQTAVFRDFRDDTDLRGRLSALSPGAALRIIITDLDSGKSYKLLQLTEPGEFLAILTRYPTKGEYNPSKLEKLKKEEEAAVAQLALKRQLFESPTRCLITVEVAGPPDKSESGRTEAVFDELVLEWPRPDIPVALSPPQGSKLTDIAVLYRMGSETERFQRSYEIEVASDRRFSDVVFRHEVCPERHMFKRDTWLHEIFIPKELYPLGEYFYHIRGVSFGGTPGGWSEAKSFGVVSKDLVQKPLIVKATAREPLFILGGGGDPALRRALPAAVRERLFVQTSVPDDTADIRAWAQENDGFIVLHAHNAVDLAKAEYLFQHHDNVWGISFGEKGFDKLAFRRTLQLAAKYGRFTMYAGKSGHMLGDFDDPRNTRLGRELGSYLVPYLKMNNVREPFAKIAIALGLYASGRCDMWSAETEFGNAYKMLDFSWARSAKKTVTTSPVDWMPPLVMGLAAGAPIYRVEGFSGNKGSDENTTFGWPGGPSEKAAKVGLGTLWTHAVGPFFTDILEHQLIPTREQVREKIRVAFQARPEYAIERPGSSYTAYPNVLVAAAHGISYKDVEPDEIFNCQWVPDGSRYYIVPMLPIDTTEQERSYFRQVLDPEKIKSPQDLIEILNRYYPPSRSNVFCTLVGDTGVVINTIDRMNDAVEQHYDLQFTKGPVAGVEGEVSFRQYILAKQYRNATFLHCNNYEDRQTKLRLVLNPPADIEVQPASALVEQSETDDQVVLTLSHHDGVVRIWVR